ncbi:hypothetical protein FRB99_005850 [Tulasnella sp. 403]|nr:hypothetical protein FRB99_005850 [Tulasnella sp. 403]
MFRACFPTAPDEAEKAETNWVKTNFDTAGSNGGGRLRLAGSWVPPSLALYLATSYSLTDILPALANAVPEAKASYRKSTRPGNANGPSASGFTSNASQTVVNGNTASTHGIPTSLPPTTPKSVKSPMSKSSTKAGSPSRPPPAKRSRKSASPAPSTLLKSTPGKVNFTSPHRQADVPEEEEPEVPGPDPDQDIAEAKAEVARLKAEHSIVGPATPAASKKRAIEATETPPPKFDMERIEQSAMDLVQDRPIINRRRLSNLPPTRKAAAWGSLAFLLGLGFSAALPTLLPGGGFW